MDFIKTVEQMHLEGPNLHQWQIRVRVIRGEEDVGTVMQFEGKALFGRDRHQPG